MGWLFGSSSYDLKGEVTKLIFERKAMKPVTLDVDLFISVMNVFTQYEKAVSSCHFKSQDLLLRIIELSHVHDNINQLLI